MRLGIGTTLDHDNPQEWADDLVAMGCTAAVSPFDCTTSPALRRAYLDQAQSHDLRIGEVGAWKNVMSAQISERESNIAYVQEQLALAEDIHARCCVNISGNAGFGDWDQYSAENYLPETYDRIVETTQRIIDAVNPQHTTYAMECMPWMIPDSPEQYLQLIDDVDRPAFSVHLDYTNMMNGIERWRNRDQFIERCFSLLGNRILSVHVKDAKLLASLPTAIVEVQPGEGGIDCDMVVRHIAKLPEDTTVFVEHLPDHDAYARAMSYVNQRLQSL
ncbi:sugar phosphate isomerase/epimerase family protein [Bifidobacterium aquikefiri]|uniref:sugar phosphate isomerase/epimerase family protein n=1 Tax=Bifidobacterium aquikefiri TaxID=1653207 RepID=UPI0023F0DF2F|nr:TIM barrel protein [Bifidobacterium aquikefiri]